MYNTYAIMCICNYMYLYVHAQIIVRIEIAYHSHLKLQCFPPKFRAIYVNSLSLLPSPQNGQTPLHLAAKAGHQWIVEVFLLCNMTVIDIQDTINKETALHIASTMNWGEAVISLIERGANEMLENKVRRHTHTHTHT